MSENIEKKTAKEIYPLIPQEIKDKLEDWVDILINDVGGEDGLFNQNRNDSKTVLLREYLVLFKEEYYSYKFNFIPQSRKEWQELFVKFI